MISFFPTNPANIKDRKGVLQFKAIVRTDTETASSKLIVTFKGAEIELYKIDGYSKQTETYDGQVKPINNPENTIFDILKENGKLKIRNYDSDIQAKNFIATGMYVPGSRSGTEQFSDATQQTVRTETSDADKAIISDVSPQAAAVVERATNTDSPETSAQQAPSNSEAGSEIPESPPQSPSTPTAPDAGDANDGDGSLPGSFGGDFLSGGSGFTSKSTKQTPGTGDAGLFYPADMATLPQDYIKIQSKRYEPEKFTLSTAGIPSLEKNRKGLQDDGPPIYLAINTALTDSNTVSWGENSLNPIQAQMFKLAYNSITDNPGEAIKNFATETQNLFNQAGGNLAKAASTYFAQQSVGASGLLSRTQGAILNPNLALLFNNPELRKLNFTFRFSPRGKDEATNVRKIIRVFKQTMAVRKEKTNFFLLAPNLYDITYVPADSSSGHHKSIGRTKLCALLGCSVNYVPDGSYMTFDDDAKTMTSYEMSLSFNEIEPVYYDDYDEIKDPDEIGF